LILSLFIHFESSYIFSAIQRRIRKQLFADHPFRHIIQSIILSVFTGHFIAYYPKLKTDLLSWVLETLAWRGSAGVNLNLSDLFIPEVHFIFIWDQTTQIKIDLTAPSAIFYTG
jgi:hypothetical protein